MGLIDRINEIAGKTGRAVRIGGLALAAGTLSYFVSDADARSSSEVLAQINGIQQALDGAMLAGKADYYLVVGLRGQLQGLRIEYQEALRQEQEEMRRQSEEMKSEAEETKKQMQQMQEDMEKTREAIEKQKQQIAQQGITKKNDTYVAREPAEVAPAYIRKFNDSKFGRLSMFVCEKVVDADGDGMINVNDDKEIINSKETWREGFAKTYVTFDRKVQLKKVRIEIYDPENKLFYSYGGKESDEGDVGGLSIRSDITKMRNGTYTFKVSAVENFNREIGRITFNVRKSE